MATSPLDLPLDKLVRAPSPTIKLLAGMGLHAVRDLLLHLPMRHDALQDVTLSGFSQAGGKCTVVATVIRSGLRRVFARRMTMVEAVLDSPSGKVNAVWFNQPYVAKRLTPGASFRFTGTLSQTKRGLKLVNPFMETAAPEQAAVYSGSLTPVYPLTTGVSQHTLHRLMTAARPFIRLLDDPLPLEIRQRYALPELATAVEKIHFPETIEESEAGRRRLGFDEVFRLQLALATLRRLRERESAPGIPFAEEQVKAFVAGLPFTLTEDQRRAAWDIIKDCERASPMQRLLNGDVGSGKTVVGAIAAFNAACGGWQSAFMAPTEILAEQHFKTLTSFFAKTDLRIALWTHSYKRSAKKGRETVCENKKEAALLQEAVADGGISIVVGTHALVQESLRFSRLGFVTIDEQHRFGVRTRQALREKSGVPGMFPHLLSMTATPIPRSLALTVYGDLDLSLLKEKPKHCKSIDTKVVPKTGRKKAYAFMAEQIQKGRQAFVVCPLIDPSDELGYASVTEEYQRLCDDEFADKTVAMLHGKMAPAEKEETMRKFKNHEADILVSTSVIEVGVDVPNATVMWIEGADRFGLAQLHQFRGRVGRGAEQSYCLLLPKQEGEQARARLKALEDSDDGFVLAEKDLAMRGHGELLGEAQSGLPQFRVASLGDVDMIRDAREAARMILDQDPELQNHPRLAKMVEDATSEVHRE